MSTIANREPFSIKDCALVTIATGQKGPKSKRNEKPFAYHGLGSIYHHFWGGLLRPRFDEPEYNNDFAEWVHHALQDNILAERLSVIDPDPFVNLESLRQELLEVINQRLDEIETINWAKSDMEFHFVRAKMVVFDTRGKIAEPEELVEAVPNMSRGQHILSFY